MEGGDHSAVQVFDSGNKYVVEGLIGIFPAYTVIWKETFFRIN